MSSAFKYFYLTLAILAAAGCASSRHRFYPIGIYSVSNTNDLAKVRAAGFNVVAGAARQGYLDAAHRAGLKVLASPHTSAGPDFKAIAARRAVENYDAHPALWAWYLIDEPDLHRVDPRRVAEAHRFIKITGARKPTALVLYQGYSALHYAHLSDILMIDRYPIPWLPLANFPQHMKMGRLALGTKKPLIAVIQAFDWSYYPDQLEKKNLRPPTYAELRCMTYCALAEQANGLFYYTFNDGRWNMEEHPEVWESLKQIVAEVNALQPLFQAKHMWWPYTHSFGDHTQAFNAALNSSITTALLRVKIGSDQVPAGDYVLCVNNTGQEQNYFLKFPQPIKIAVPVFGENRLVPAIDNWIQDTFQPYAVHIYGPVQEKVSEPH